MIKLMSDMSVVPCLAHVCVLLAWMAWWGWVGRGWVVCPFFLDHLSVMIVPGVDHGLSRLGLDRLGRLSRDWAGSALDLECTPARLTWLGCPVLPTV